MKKLLYPRAPSLASQFTLTFLLIICFIISIKPYLNSRFPYTHDGENHLARFANYKIAVKEGQIPPRFAPNLFNRYGYPVFNYNYPLANILSLPFSFLKINYEITFKLISISFIALGLLGINHWLKKLKLNQESRLLAQTLFVLNPYLINLVYFRGNIGEIMALGLLPWLFYIIEKIASKKTKHLLTVKDIAIFTAFLLSHNITVLFTIPFLIIYALFKFKKDLFTWKKLGLNFIYAVCLSLWFWLPAIAEKSEVVLDAVDLSKGFNKHFPRLSQLLFSTYSFGFSYLSKIDSISFNLGYTQWTILLIGLIVIYKLFKQTKDKVNCEAREGALGYKHQFQYLKLFSILTFLLIIFQLDFTTAIWKILPLASYIQFPWRLSLFFSILILPLAAIVFSLINKKIRLLIVAMILVQLLCVTKTKPADYFHRTNVDYDAFPQSSSTLNENTAKTFTYQIGEWQLGPVILEGNGESEIAYWKGSSRQYKLNLQEKSIIVESTMKYLGWQTTVNGNKITYIDSEEIGGRIAYQLPAGEYTIISKFTQNTWARIVGNTVTLLSFTFLLVYQYKLFNPKFKLCLSCPKKN